MISKLSDSWSSAKQFGDAVPEHAKNRVIPRL